MAVQVKISELRLIINRILNHIEYDLKKAEVVLDENSYWDVPAEERYDFTKIPENFEHGQLDNDWGFLSHILDDPDLAFALMLVHVAPLLRRISEQVQEYE